MPLDAADTEKPQPWLVSGTLVYRLNQIGWRKGEPVMANQYAINVQAQHNGNEADAEDLARKVAGYLNSLDQ